MFGSGVVGLILFFLTLRNDLSKLFFFMLLFDFEDMGLNLLHAFGRKLVELQGDHRSEPAEDGQAEEQNCSDPENLGVSGSAVVG